MSTTQPASAAPITAAKGEFAKGWKALFSGMIGVATGASPIPFNVLPIVIGLAGNVGVQASTILVRAFATGEVEKEREFSVLISEVQTGMLIGLLCGGATAIVATLLGAGGGENFGIAVGAAIAVAVTWAAFLGCVVPLSCRRLGIDPAVVAGPFLITLSDISGAVIFFSLGRLLLGL